MVDFLSNLFDGSDFPARWHCGKWSPGHGYLHIVSDLMIFGAYVTIPLLLLMLLRKKSFGSIPEPLPSLAGYFGAFIICCGMTHLNEAIIFYHPFYRWAGVTKLATAIVSWATVAALVPALPKILNLSTPSELRRQVIEATNALTLRSKELERSNRELDSYASAASHDLKAPLRAVQHIASWLEEDIPAEALTKEVRSHLELLRSRTNRMDALLDALLNYARVGKDKSVPEEFEVEDALNNTIELLGEQARASVSVDGRLPRITTTRVLFEQVLFNLIANALKHADSDRVRVIVRAKREGDRHVFEVQDNGPGIAARYHEKIFRVFETLHPRDEREAVGMGLALVRKIVESQGGKVTVISEEGQGATFVFDWPVVLP